MQAVYQRWKLTPEWKWLQGMTKPPGNEERARLSIRKQWLLADLGIKPATSQQAFDKARFFSPLSSSENKAPTTAITKKDEGPPPPLPPPRDDLDNDTPLPPVPANQDLLSQIDLITTIERLQRDLAAVTQERDQLRKIISTQQEQQPIPPSTFAPSMVIPQAPALPAPAMPPKVTATTDKGQVADLLQALRSFDKEKKLKQAPSLSEKQTVTKKPATGAGGLTGALENALKSRRGALREDSEIDGQIPHPNSDTLEVIECQMCYSEGVLQCSDCKIAMYCGAECQKSHWEASHSTCCLPAYQRFPLL
jgi:hypothetical protein